MAVWCSSRDSFLAGWLQAAGIKSSHRHTVWGICGSAPNWNDCGPSIGWRCAGEEKFIYSTSRFERHPLLSIPPAAAADGMALWLDGDETSGRLGAVTVPLRCSFSFCPSSAIADLLSILNMLDDDAGRRVWVDEHWTVSGGDVLLRVPLEDEETRSDDHIYRVWVNINSIPIFSLSINFTSSFFSPRRPFVGLFYTEWKRNRLYTRL